MSIAFLFPGQGSQRPGMLHRLPDTEASATVLAEADWALRRLAARPVPGPGAGEGAERRGPGPRAEYADGIVELDTAQALEGSALARQVALLIAGVAGARAVMEDEEVRPGFVAGHGVGGYAAAVVAGVLTFEEALWAVRLRGELLDRAAESEEIIAVRCAQHLATVVRRPQGLPFVSGVFGRCLRGETNAVFDDLAQSVARPVRWAEMVSALSAEGVSRCVELPPGRALTALLQGGVPVMPAVSVEEYGIAEAGDFARGGPRSDMDMGAEDMGADMNWGTGGGSGSGSGTGEGAGAGEAGAGPDTGGGPRQGPAQSGLA
jgi:malonyl CoA-acyl carrier protein transacylase